MTDKAPIGEYSNQDQDVAPTPAIILRAAFYLGRHNTTKWNKHAKNQAVRTRS